MFFFDASYLHCFLYSPQAHRNRLLIVGHNGSERLKCQSRKRLDVPHPTQDSSVHEYVDLQHTATAQSCDCADFLFLLFYLL